MSLVSLTSSTIFNNSKLFFSKKELCKILSCYSIGVSCGKWKDYSIDFDQNEANFFIYKHTSSYPDCILTKYKKSKKNKTTFKLKINNKNKKKSDKIEDLIAILKRKYITIL